MVTAQQLYEPNAGLVALAGAILVIWYVVLAAFVIARWPKSPRAAPSSTDLRPEPPAVANLLVNGWLANEDALPATLLDLAARGHVIVEDRGDGHMQCRLQRRGVDRDRITPYEAKILAHLNMLASGGVVAAGALTTGPQDQSTRWWRSFRKDVMDEAVERGLARSFWPKWLSLAFTGAGVPVYLTLAAAQDFRDSDDVMTTPGIMMVTLGMWAGAALLFVLAGTARLRDTAAGRIAAAHWLGVKKSLDMLPSFKELPPSGVTVWGRHLAYGAGLGVAGRAVRALPLGAESDTRAWSDRGGHWHQVTVRYPRFRPGWGRHPLLALGIGIVRTTVAVWILRFAHGLGVFDRSTFKDDTWWVGPIVYTIALLLGVIAVWSAVGVVLAVLDLFTTSIVSGEVLRTRTRRGLGVRSWSEDQDDLYFVAVYTGQPGDVIAWAVRPKLYGRFYQGQEVTVEVTKWLGYVREVVT